MIPIRDTNRSRKATPVRDIFILVNLAVFIYTWTLTRPEVSQHIEFFGFLTPRFYDAPVLHSYSLFTYQFLHGGLWHFLGNMWYLWVFGKNVEAKMGSKKFLVFYLFAGMISCMVQVIVVPYGNVPLVGASGSIAGVLGVYAAFFPRARIMTWIPFGLFGWTTHVRAFFFLAFWFLYQFILGYSSYDPYAASGGVAWWAHVGGFVLGLLFGLSVRK